MVGAMAGAFMTISMDQSHGEPIAAMSHEIEIAGSGSICDVKTWDVDDSDPNRIICTNGGTEKCPCTI